MLVLLAGAVGAGLVVLAVRQAWAHATFTPPRPLPAQDIAVTGQQLVPLASALALAALACLAAVIATRSVLRRAVGVLLAVLGAATAVAVLASLRASAVLAAARATALSGRLHHERRALGGRGARDRHRRPRPCDLGRRALARGGHRRRGRDRAGGRGDRLARPALAGHVRALRAFLPQTPARHRLGVHVGVAEP